MHRGLRRRGRLPLRPESAKRGHRLRPLAGYPGQGGYSPIITATANDGVGSQFSCYTLAAADCAPLRVPQTGSPRSHPCPAATPPPRWRPPAPPLPFLLRLREDFQTGPAQNQTAQIEWKLACAIETRGRSCVGHTPRQPLPPCALPTWRCVCSHRLTDPCEITERLNSRGSTVPGMVPGPVEQPDGSVRGRAPTSSPAPGTGELGGRRGGREG